MKRFLSLLATGALALGLSTTAHAQLTRPFGAGAFVLDDLHGHKVTLEAPVFGSPEGNAWAQTTPPYMPLTWSIPVPPSAGAQSGFMYAGPLVPNTYSTTGPAGPGTALATPYTLPVWINPGYQGFNHYGGAAGAWDYATTTQLGIVTLAPPLSNTANIIPKTDGAGGFTSSSMIDDGAVLHVNGNTATVDETTGDISTIGNIQTTLAGNISTTGTGSITSATTMTAGTGLTVTDGGASITTLAVGGTALTITAPDGSDVSGDNWSVDGLGTINTDQVHSFSSNAELDLSTNNVLIPTGSLGVQSGNIRIVSGVLGIGGAPVIDNSRNLINVNNITAGGTITFSSLTNQPGVVHNSAGGVLSSSGIVVGDITPGGNNTFLNTDNGGAVGWNALNVDGTTLQGNGSSGGTALAINLNNPNTWTADQTFNGAGTSLAVGTDETVGGTLTVTGLTTTNGGLTNNGAFTTAGGAASINAGADANTVDIGDGSGANAIGIGNTASTNTINGSTTINGNVDNSTSINTGTSNGVVTIGNTTTTTASVVVNEPTSITNSQPGGIGGATGLSVVDNYGVGFGAFDLTGINISTAGGTAFFGGTGINFDITNSVSGPGSNVDINGTANSWSVTSGGAAAFASVNAGSGTIQTTGSVLTGTLTASSTGSFGGAVNMNSHQINALANPTLATDAANLGTVTAAVNAAVNGTTNTLAIFTGANAVGNSGITESVGTIHSNDFLMLGDASAHQGVVQLYNGAGGGTFYTIAPTGTIMDVNTNFQAEGNMNVTTGGYQTAGTTRIDNSGNATLGTLSASATLANAPTATVSNNGVDAAGQKSVGALISSTGAGLGANIALEVSATGSTGAGGGNGNFGIRVDNGDVSVQTGNVGIGAGSLKVGGGNFQVLNSGAVTATSLNAGSGIIQTTGNGSFGTLSSSGLATLNSASVTTTLGVTGLSTLTGGASMGGDIAMGGHNITGGGTITGTTITGTAFSGGTGAFSTLSSSGLATLNSASVTTTLGVTGLASTNGGLTNTGALTLSGANSPINASGSNGNAGDVLTSQGTTLTPHWVSGASAFIQNQNASAQTPANFWIAGNGQLGGTLAVGGATTTTGLTNTGNFTTSGGTNDIEGATTINTTSGSNTSIGKLATGNVNVNGANIDIEDAPGNHIWLNQNTGLGSTVIGHPGAPGTGSTNVDVEADNASTISLATAALTTAAVKIGTGGSGVVNIGNVTGGTAVTGTLGVTGLSTLTGGASMGGDIAMGTHNITGATNVTATGTVTGGTGTFTNLSGTQMAGTLNLNNNNITNGGTITGTTITGTAFSGGTGAFSTLSSSGLATLNSASVTTTLGVTGLSTLTGGASMGGDIAMGTHNITNGGTINGTTITGTAFSGGTGAFSTLSSSGLATLNSASVTTTLGVTGLASTNGGLTNTGALTLSGANSPINASGSNGNAGDVLTSQGTTLTPHWVSGASAFIQNQNAGAQTPANFWISGNGQLGGTLNVTGLSTLTGGASMGGDIAMGGHNITGGGTITGTTITGTAFSGGTGAFSTLSSSGLATLNSASVTTTLGVTGLASTNGGLTNTGALTLSGANSPINASGSNGNAGDVLTSQGTTLTPHWVSGASAFIQNQNAGAQTPANFWISGNGQLGGTLNVTGLSTLTGGASMGGDIAMGGHNITGGGTITGTAFSGGTGAFSTLSSSGLATLNSASVTTTLGVTGLSTLTGGASMGGDIAMGGHNITGGGTITGTTITGTAFSGGTGAFSTLSSSGATTFSGIGGLGIVHSSGVGLLSSSLIVDGDITPGTISNASLANSTITVTGGTGLGVAGSPVALGGTVTLSNTGVTSDVAGTGISVNNGGVGAVTITNAGVLSVGASGVLSSSGGQNPSISLTGIVAPANGGTGQNFSATGGTSGDVIQEGVAGTFTVGQLSSSQLSDAANLITTSTAATGNDLTGNYPGPTIASTAGNDIVDAISNVATTHNISNTAISVTAGAASFTGNSTINTSGTGTTTIGNTTNGGAVTIKGPDVNGSTPTLTVQATNTDALGFDNPSQVVIEGTGGGPDFGQLMLGINDVGTYGTIQAQRFAIGGIDLRIQTNAGSTLIGNANTNSQVSIKSGTGGITLNAPATKVTITNLASAAPSGYLAVNGSNQIVISNETLLTSGTSAGGDLTGSYPNPTIAATVGAGNHVVAAINAATTDISNSSINITAVNLTSTGIVTVTPSSGGFDALTINNGSGLNDITGTSSNWQVSHAGDATFAPTIGVGVTVTNAGSADGMDVTNSSVTNTANALHVTNSSTALSGYAGVAITMSNGTATATGPALELTDGHLDATQTANPVASVTNVGGAASTTATSTDVAGEVSFTNDATVADEFVGGTDNVSVTFSKHYATAPFVIITPADQTTADMLATASYFVTPTATGFSLGLSTGATTGINKTYSFYYHVIE